MTVAALTPSVDYLGDGVSVDFPLPFRFLAPGVIKVARELADGTILPLTYGAEYSVTGGGSDAGGTLVMTVAPPTGTKIHAWRDTPLAQTADYTTGDRFPAETHEGVMDKLMMADQEAAAQLGRTLMVPRGEAAPLIERAAVRSGRHAMWGSDGALISGSDADLAQDILGPLLPLLPPGLKGDPGANVMSIGLFTQLAGLSIPQGTTLIQTAGHTAAGRGSALYIEDAAANAALAAAYPGACRQSANGRYFRVIPISGWLSPEMIGCPEYAPGVNQQPWIQALVDYAHAIGHGALYFPQDTYELWSPTRVAPAGQGYANTNHTGEFIALPERAWLLDGRFGNRTRFNYKGPAGGNLQLQYQTVTATAYGGEVIWRGAGIKLRGSVNAAAARPADVSLCHLHMRNIWMFSDSVGVRNTDWPAWPRTRDPSAARENCWDISNKGIYCQQDVHIGNVTLENVTVQGFLGECIYTSGTYSAPVPEAGARIVLRNCVFRDTNGQALNANGPAVLDVDGFYSYNCSFAFEGWAGITYGRIVNAHFRLCKLGGLRGSNIYASPLRVDGTFPPTTVDAIFEDCGEVLMGGYVQGRITCIDCGIAIVPENATTKVEGLNLDVTLICHTKFISYGVRWAAITGTVDMISNNVIRVDSRRTKEAEAASFWCGQVMSQAGPLGKSNYVYARGFFNAPGGVLAALGANCVGLIDEGIDWSQSSFGVSFDPTTTPNPDWSPHWLRATGVSGGAGNWPVNLPATTAFPEGAEIVLLNQTGGGSNVIVEVRDATGLRALVQSGAYARFTCSRGRTRWDLTRQSQPHRGTANIDVASTALGAESGPYTIALPGCQPYLSVRVTPASILTGFVISAVRPETNQVSFWVRNVDGANPQNPPAQIFTATVVA